MSENRGQADMARRKERMRASDANTNAMAAEMREVMVRHLGVAITGEIWPRVVEALEVLYRHG